MYWKPFDGAGPAERLLETDYSAYPSSWLPDGRTLIFLAFRDETGSDIGRVTVGDSTPEWVLATEFNEFHPQVSPDGHWLAYTSNRSGEREVYVEALSGEGGRTKISTNGGESPRWSPDGKILYYVIDGALIAASLQTAPELRVMAPRTEVASGFTDVNPENVNYDLHPKGEEFLAISQGGTGPTLPIVWILDWLEIVRRMETGR